MMTHPADATHTEYAVVLTTCASHDEAIALARLLVEARLVACAQILPIESVYMWKDSVSEDKEYLLLLKAKGSDFADIETMIRKNHTYETPEIVQVPLTAGHRPYFDWIRSVTL